MSPEDRPAAGMDTTPIEIAERLYGAFRARDVGALMEVLHPRFRGEVSAGMPLGLGGRYDGPEQMLTECWARVLEHLDTRPEPEEYLPVAGASRLVVLGRYLGSERSSGSPHEAAFVHVLGFESSRIDELIQVTDTERWHRALGTSGSGAQGVGGD